jgi:hypothetical protein
MDFRPALAHAGIDFEQPHVRFHRTARPAARRGAGLRAGLVSAGVVSHRRALQKRDINLSATMENIRTGPGFCEAHLPEMALVRAILER